MSAKIMAMVDYVNHPVEHGVYLKHFFGSADNDRLSNVEVRIEPGCRIGPHVHEKTSEFYYLVQGEGDFFIDGEWHPVSNGCAVNHPRLKSEACGATHRRRFSSLIDQGSAGDPSGSFVRRS